MEFLIQHNSPTAEVIKINFRKGLNDIFLRAKYKNKNSNCVEFVLHPAGAGVRGVLGILLSWDENIKGVPEHGS